MTVELTSPYTSKDNEYLGQLHCHSTNSDGVDTPAALVTAYKNAGYDFVSVTDHNQATPDPGIAGILFIQGNEQTSTEGHIIATNTSIATGIVAPQTIIDAFEADGAIVSMAHPNLVAIAPWTVEQLKALTGYTSIEVWTATVPPADNSEDVWNALLDDSIVCFGNAVDDCHDITGNFNLGWVKVFADNLTVANIMASLSAGNYYASTGPDIAIVIVDNIITITTAGASTIDFVGHGGAVLQTESAITSSSYTVAQCDVYVRVRVTRDADSKMAWSNPIWVVEKSTGKTSSPWMPRCRELVEG